MTTINLYQNQEDDKRKMSQRAANSGFVFAISILIITVLSLIGLKVYASMLTKQSQQLSDNVNQQNDSLAGVNNLQKILDLQERLSKIKSNLQIKNGAINSVKMTSVLSQLSSDLSSGIIVEAYEFDDSGQVKVTFSANSFSDAARQILNFKKSDYFSNVQVANIARGEKNISCNVIMDIKKQ